MTQTDYLQKFFDNFIRKISEIDLVTLATVARQVKALKKSAKLIVVGNGGSAAIASHAAVDFTKVAGVRSVCFNDSSLLTCFANDYGYENWVSKALEFYADKDDYVILISSSGKSKNMINAAEFCIQKGINFFVLTGFEEDNSLRQLSDLNIYVNSENYNIVENTHQICILSLVDLIAKNEFD